MKNEIAPGDESAIGKALPWLPARAVCVKVVVIFVGEDTPGKDGEARQCLGIVDAARRSQTQMQPEDADKIYEKCSIAVPEIS